jgi:hypothetical protein
MELLVLLHQTMQKKLSTAKEALLKKVFLQ